MKFGILIGIAVALSCSAEAAQQPGNAPSTGGIDKSAYDSILDKVEKVYGPIVQSKGYALGIVRRWQSDYRNASAGGNDKLLQPTFYGGYPRDAHMTADGFALVACSVLGLYMPLGGAPHVEYIPSSKYHTPVPGQAYYFGASKCLRKVFADEDNQAIAGRMDVDPTVEHKCADAFAGDGNKIAMCERIAMAGLSVVKATRPESVSYVGFNTPDASQVRTTEGGYPSFQCMLDTFFQGSLCAVSSDVDFDPEDPTVGACTGSAVGARPRCWFKPN